ncbi:hypothetical protein [Bosea massiliensis]|uniref:Uncharacterized protein n=1 Tax=Bosea massiliensis TaxID=151419 RepID=A0ABW0NXC3_9HYPH
MKLTSSSIRTASQSPPETLRERLLALREGSRFLEAVKFDLI